MYEIRFRDYWSRLSRRDTCYPVITGSRPVCATFGSRPEYPDLEQLPDELKYGYETGGEEPSLRTLGGHPIALADSKHNWQYVAKATDKAPPLPVATL